MATQVSLLSAHRCLKISQKCLLIHVLFLLSSSKDIYTNKNYINILLYDYKRIYVQLNASIFLTRNKNLSPHRIFYRNILFHE